MNRRGGKGEAMDFLESLAAALLFGATMAVVFGPFGLGAPAPPPPDPPPPALSFTNGPLYVFDRLLTDEETQEIYRRGASGCGWVAEDEDSPVLSCWDLSEDQGPYEEVNSPTAVAGAVK